MPEIPSTEPQKTILIVEDDRFLRDIIVKHLQKAGFVMAYAATGEEALHEAVQQKPDLIILDIVLSGINGLDVMARLQKEEATKKIPFIVFSNSDETASVNRGKDLGAIKYLVKAISTPEQIVREVKEYFARAV